MSKGRKTKTFKNKYEKNDKYFLTNYDEDVKKLNDLLIKAKKYNDIESYINIQKKIETGKMLQYNVKELQRIETLPDVEQGLALDRLYVKMKYLDTFS